MLVDAIRMVGMYIDQLTPLQISVGAGLTVFVLVTVTIWAVLMRDDLEER